MMHTSNIDRKSALFPNKPTRTTGRGHESDYSRYYPSGWLGKEDFGAPEQFDQISRHEINIQPTFEIKWGTFEVGPS
jgi:hypothetical protein